MERIQKLITKQGKWILLFSCLVLFLMIVEDVFDEEIREFDIRGYELITSFFPSAMIASLAKGITHFGGAFFLITLSILCFFLIQNKKIRCSIFINLVVITGMNQLLKNIIQRPRPEEYRLIEESGYSFPSGHSMVSMAFYRISYLFNLSLCEKPNSKMDTYHRT